MLIAHYNDYSVIECVKKIIVRFQSNESWNDIIWMAENESATSFHNTLKRNGNKKSVGKFWPTNQNSCQVWE